MVSQAQTATSWEENGPVLLFAPNGKVLPLLSLPLGRGRVSVCGVFVSRYFQLKLWQAIGTTVVRQVPGCHGNASW